MINRKYVWPAFAALTAVSILVWVWTRFADIWLPSLAFYAGLAVMLTGLVSLLLPLRLFGICTRKCGAIVALGGLALSCVALAWPSGSGPRLANGSAELDRVMPQFDRSERHEIRIASSCDAVRRAVDEVTFTDIRGLQTLMSLRAARKVAFKPRPVLATMTGPGAGFTLLARTDGEFVAGNVGRPWKNERPTPISGAEEFRSFAGPGYAKVAFNLRTQPDGPGWCKAATETRVLATDSGARTAFSRYWRVVYPGSALIRVLWLDAVERRLHS